MAVSFSWQSLCKSGHFHFGKYVDSVMQSRVTAWASRSSSYGVEEDTVRTSVIFRDKTSQKYILLAMSHYATALKLDAKHVYQALPRLLSLWFDFASIRQDQVKFEGIGDGSKSEYAGKDFELAVNTLCLFVLTDV
jgi:hypothetical protein